jgi:hypothetical protein
MMEYTIVRVINSGRMRWAGHVARTEEGRGVYRVLVGKPEGRRPLGRPRRGWEDIIKTDIREVGSGVMDWTLLAEGDFLTSCKPVSFARRTVLHGLSK